MSSRKQAPGHSHRLSPMIMISTVLISWRVLTGRAISRGGRGVLLQRRSANFQGCRCEFCCRKLVSVLWGHS